MRQRYVYQRSGGPLLSWRYAPPYQSRAGETRGLGSLDEPTIALPLPRGGAPEPVGDCGCGGRNDIVIDLMSPSFLVGAAVGAFLLSKLLRS